MAISTGTPLQVPSSATTAIAKVTAITQASITTTETLTLAKANEGGSAGSAVLSNGVLSSWTAPT